MPQLGQPLPGDLARPIVGAQNRGRPVPKPGVATPKPCLTPEEQRRIQELEASRSARLFASTETRMAAATPGAQPIINLGLAPSPATPTAQDRQNAFLSAATDRRMVAPDRVAAPVSPNILQAGAVISAALITGIRSDLPGQVIAQDT